MIGIIITENGEISRIITKQNAFLYYLYYVFLNGIAQ